MAIFFGALLMLLLVFYIISRCCCDKSRKEPDYSEIPTKEDFGKENRGSSTSSMNLHFINEKDPKENRLPNVSKIEEFSAEISVSDIEGEDVTLTAYGDTMTVASMDSKYSWLSLNTVTKMNLHVQCSLIYSKEMKYVAGKIIQLDGINIAESNSSLQAKVHVVVLPAKKYALKTNWYDINRKAAKVQIGEYFKYQFRKKSLDFETIFRIRAYGRRNNIGTLGRNKCMGECYINLKEIINSRGGLTLWRLLTRGIGDNETIVEE